MNWNQDTLFNRERFEAWVFSQPDARQWDYISNDKCALCSFIRDSSSAKLFSASSYFVRLDSGFNIVDIPTWLSQLIWDARMVTGNHKAIFTASELKRAYTQMFPEQEINVPINQQTEVKTNQKIKD